MLSNVLLISVAIAVRPVALFVKVLNVIKCFKVQRIKSRIEPQQDGILSMVSTAATL